MIQPSAPRLFDEVVPPPAVILMEVLPLQTPLAELYLLLHMQLAPDRETRFRSSIGHLAGEQVTPTTQPVHGLEGVLRQGLVPQHN